jgi:hypothetical protein
MNVLAAIFVAGVGLYTIYRGPRSWPHWLAGCAALGFAFVDRVFPFEASGRGIGFTFVAALCLSAATYLVNGSARNLRLVALALAVGISPLLVPGLSGLLREEFYNFGYVIVGLLALIFLIAPGRYWQLKTYLATLVTVFFIGVVGSGSVVFQVVLYFIPVWGGGFLIRSTSRYRKRIENIFWRTGILFMAAGFILAFYEYSRGIDISPHTGLEYLNHNPALRELSAWLAPLLAAVGIVATCFAVIRLIPHQPDAQPIPIELSDKTNPL